MVIRRLTLQRFRGFQHFEWYPQAGLNCLVGAGDTGKTTVLEAISRAVSPAPGGPASEHDYFERRTEDGFEIELVIGALSPELKGSFRPPALWGWQGENQPLRQAPLETTEPVLRVVVRGTPDLELEHRLLSPDGEELFLSVDKRRLFGLCRVGDSRGSAREFRMARGSLLERTLGREDVRGAAAVAVRNASKDLQLPQEVEQRLEALGDLLSSDGVSHDPVTLEVLSPPGQSLLGLLGLALGLRGEAIGLSYAGQGTQRLASFVLARELALSPPLVVVDEVEVGLEPYRRRLLVQQLRKLLAGGGQAFLTTHSSTVLSELHVEEVHRLAWHRRAADDDEGGNGLAPRLTRLSSSLAKTKDDDAEALLCRLPIICEGQTERELLRVLLEQHAQAAGYSLAALGVQLVDGGGQPSVFSVVDAYCEADFHIGLFLDTETTHQGRRAERAQREEVTAGAWSGATCTEEALANGLPLQSLEDLLGVGDVERLDERRRKQLCECLGYTGELGVLDLLEHFSEKDLRAGWATAAHKRDWFKPRAHARALAEWLGTHDLPGALRADLASFWNALATRLPTPATAGNDDPTPAT